MKPLIDYVLVVRDELRYTKECVESILRNSPVPFRIILVDNASTDGTGPYFRSLAKATPAGAEIAMIQLRTNEGYTRAANRGLAVSEAPFVMLLNNDVVVYPGAVREMLRVLEENPELGLVNPNSNEFGFGPYDAGKLASLRGKWTERFHISGFCALIRREVFERAGRLNPVFSPGYFEDMDLSERARRAGYASGMAYGAYVHHYGTRTFKTKEKKALWKRHSKIFNELWGGIERWVFLSDAVSDTARRELLGELLRRVREKHRYIYLYVPPGTGSWYRDRHAGIRVREVPPALQYAAAAFKFLSAALRGKPVTRLFVGRERTEAPEKMRIARPEILPVAVGEGGRAA